VFKLVENVEDVEYLTRVGGDFDGLVSAFTWLESNAEANTKYTIRVEKNETDLPHLIVSLNKQEGASLRLRGTKEGPWNLEPVNGSKPFVNEKSLTKADAFIQVGAAQKNPPKSTFILGRNVTIRSRTITGAQNSTYIGIFIVGYNATLVLEPGSKITGHDSSTWSGTGSCMIWIKATSSNTARDPTKHGKLRIEGGEISNCKVNGTDSGLFILAERPRTEMALGSLYLAGGNVFTLSNITDKDNKSFADARFRYNDGTPYNLTQYLGSGLSAPAE
jgi:hypothetical protein